MTSKVTAGRRRGFVLISASFAALLLLGMAGLAVDVGRMYITRSEAQSFVDSAALAGALQLDGTTTGVTNAINQINNNPKKWRFGALAFTNVTADFANSATGPWLASASLPSPPSGYYYARVSTTVNLPLYLIPSVGTANLSTISAAAVAGRVTKDYFTDGIFPFSPYSHKIAAGCETCDDPNDLFGYQIGNRYTLRWAASPDLHKGNVCPADASQTMIDIANEAGASLRGYIELNSAAELTQAIISYVPTDLQVSGSADVPINLTLDSTVDMVGGAKNSVINAAVATRSSQDSDHISTTYSQYKSQRTGNGRRVVVVPINKGGPDFEIAGFAGFFLLAPSEYDLTGNQPACGEYIGSWVRGNPFSGGNSITSTNDLQFVVKLIQ